MKNKDQIKKLPVSEAIALLEEVIEQSPDCITIVNPDGYVVKTNKAYETIAGISSKELIGIHITDLVKLGVLEEALGLKALAAQKPITALQKLPKLGKDVLVTINPVFNKDGKLIFIVGSTRDLDALNRLKYELEKIREANERYKNEMEQMKMEQLSYESLICQSQKMKYTIELGKRIACHDLPVLITGESGVGKDLMARFIHRASARKDAAYVTINCAALPEQLVESELFGYQPGAFTGAGKGGKKGLFEIASGGTLFLDEVGELPLGTQAKLLRVLEDMTIRPVGGISSKCVDVRIIAATNRLLEESINKKQFREDLYYRLSVVPIHIPPLRERRDDILLLTRCFCEQFNKKYNTTKGFSKEAILALEQYNWPGNVRELRNVVERLIVCTTDVCIQPEEVYEFINCVNYVTGNEIQAEKSARMPDMRKTVRRVERGMLTEALELYGSSRKAAAALGISQSTFLRKLKETTKYNETPLYS